MEKTMKVCPSATLSLLSSCACGDNMASLIASPTAPVLSKAFSRATLQKTQLRTSICNSAALATLSTRRRSGRRAVVCWSSPAGEVGVVGESEGEKSGYLVKEFGWGVRRMAQVADEMRKVAYVQAEAFHVPAALFNDLFFEFFKAEVLSALIYRVRNSPPDRYACLVAESINITDPMRDVAHEIVGVVDVTVRRDEDVLRNLEGVEEYLYISGIAVLTKFRRQKIATVLLKACDALSLLWGYSHLVLRTYEDDSAARKLYSRAGYKVVSGDPHWITWTGRRLRVLMIKPSTLHTRSYN